MNGSESLGTRDGSSTNTAAEVAVTAVTAATTTTATTSESPGTVTDWEQQVSLLASELSAGTSLGVGSVDQYLNIHHQHTANSEHDSGSSSIQWRSFEGPVYDSLSQGGEEEEATPPTTQPQQTKLSKVATSTSTYTESSNIHLIENHSQKLDNTVDCTTSDPNHSGDNNNKGQIEPRNIKATNVKKKNMTDIGYGIISTDASTSGDLDDSTKKKAIFSNSLVSTKNDSKPKVNTNVKNAKRLDQYGFITNLDTDGIIRRSNSFSGLRGGAYTPPPPGDHRPLASLQQKKNSRNKMGRMDQRNGRHPVRIRHPRKKKHQTNRSNRRERKWLEMLKNWDSILKSPSKASKLRVRIRKGIPNTVRGQAWAKLAGVPRKVEKFKVGVYAALVEKSCGKNVSAENDSAESSGVDSNATVSLPFVPSVQTEHLAAQGTAMKDTIERDINRTFPRHSMFYDSDSISNSDDDSSDDGASAGSSMIGYESAPSSDVEIGKGNNVDNPHWAQEVIQKAAISCPSKCVKCDNDGSSSTGDDYNGNNRNLLITGKGLQKHKKSIPKKKELDLVLAEGGQASLRRILRAYSSYDPEVGYCQGMNFIAGMFITYMSEEEAFWTLVAVMQEKPCRMRGLFSEGMNEAHQVLYIADKLIAQFHPRLSRHFAKENIHITMFATQWLLTIYTSSFPFDVVTRVWDCFLTEGWKVAYRVMLALLERATPHLLKLKFEDILGYLKELPNEVNASEIVDAAFKIKVKKRHITKLAKDWEKMQK